MLHLHTYFKICGLNGASMRHLSGGSLTAAWEWEFGCLGLMWLYRGEGFVFPSVNVRELGASPAVELDMH